MCFFEKASLNFSIFEVTKRDKSKISSQRHMGSESKISCQGTWDLPYNTEQILQITAEVERPVVQSSSQCRLPEQQKGFL